MSIEYEPRGNIYFKPVTNDTNEWEKGLDVSLPIDGYEIPGFKAWINWRGFKFNRLSGKGHDGYDFAAYLTHDGNVILGLPEDTNVHSITQGTVYNIQNIRKSEDEYFNMITIEHGTEDSGMFSSYFHVAPKVNIGDRVKKGEIIASLCGDKQNKHLTHLHFLINNGWGTRGSSDHMKYRIEDPSILYTDLNRFYVRSQGKTNFAVIDCLEKNKNEIFHYKRRKI